MQETSILAYKQIKKEGVVKTQKQIILNCIKENDIGKGMSLQEIKKKTGIEINAVSGRVNDLKKENKLATCLWKIKCDVTHRTIQPVILGK